MRTKLLSVVVVLGLMLAANRRVRPALSVVAARVPVVRVIGSCG